MRVKAGDIVRVMRPEDPYENPKWVDDMDTYHNTVHSIQCVLREEPAGQIILLEGCSDFKFNSKWTIQLRIDCTNSRCQIPNKSKAFCIRCPYNKEATWNSDTTKSQDENTLP